MKYLTEMRIDRDALRHNLGEVRKLISPRTEVMAMIKADAYGHGAVETARVLEGAGVACLCLAHTWKAGDLRQAGVRGRIVALQPDFLFDFEPYARHRLECCVNSLEDVQRWRSGPKAACHLFVDTGMGREGALPEEARACIEQLQDHPALKLVGLGTHFACADESDLGHARRQLRDFNAFLAGLPPAWLRGVQIHTACSGAVINLPESHCDMVRPGIMLYGLYPGAGRERLDQRPAMSIWGAVALVKRLPAGACVGYGCDHRMPAAGNLAMISLGYGDGFSFRKRGGASVWLGGRPYPVVGRVSMDQIMVNLDQDEVSVGDEAMIYGSEPETGLVHDAGLLGTISYERACQLGMRLPRVYFN